VKAEHFLVGGTAPIFRWEGSVNQTSPFDGKLTGKGKRLIDPIRDFDLSAFSNVHLNFDGTARMSWTDTLNAMGGGGDRPACNPLFKICNTVELAPPTPIPPEPPGCL
jgi:hypothetical protein